MANNEFNMFQNWDSEKKERALLQLLDEVPPEVVRAGRKKRTLRVPIQDYIEEAQYIHSHQGEVQGLSTGMKATDDLTLGMTGGELIIVSGPPSAGKTQLVTHWAYNVAKNEHKVLFVTMEMTKPQMTERFMSASQTDLSSLTHGIIEYQKEDELASVDISYLVSDAVGDGAELIIIDHLQYFSDEDDQNEARSLGRICKQFKMAAVRYNVPVILLVHITKLADNKKPTGNDLRGSSLIRQHADQVLLIWRDERPDAKVSGEVEITNWKNRLRGLREHYRKRTLYADGARLTEQKPYVPSSANQHTTTSWQEKEFEDFDESIVGDIFGKDKDQHV